jgi:hypothetical protein
LRLSELFYGAQEEGQARGSDSGSEVSGLIVTARKPIPTSDNTRHN